MWVPITESGRKPCRVSCGRNRCSLLQVLQSCLWGGVALTNCSQFPLLFPHWPCFARNTCWQSYCSVLQLLWHCSIAFFLFPLQRRCRYHVIVSLVVVCLYPIYFGAHGDNYSFCFKCCPWFTGFVIYMFCSFTWGFDQIKNCRAATAILPESSLLCRFSTCD